jgi:hypothetical protein
VKLPARDSEFRSGNQGSAAGLWWFSGVDRYDGTPSHPAGYDSNSLPPGSNSLPERGVKRCGGGRPFLCRAIADLRCCSGNHLREPPCRLSQASRGISGRGFRRSSAWNRLCELDFIVDCFRLTSEKPEVRTLLRPPEKVRSDRMLILIRPYALNHSGNHRCTFGGAGMGPRAGSIIVDHGGTPCTDSRYHRHLPRPGSR